MRSRVAAACIGVAVAAVLACVLAPLRQTSGDTVGGRLGGLVLRCAGDWDLARVDWVAQRIASGRTPYFTELDATGQHSSIFGPAPGLAGALALIGTGDAIDDDALRIRERAMAALLLAMSAALLVLAIAARASPRSAALGGAVAVASFAGAATLGQGLWQATCALPVLTGALAAIAWRERRPRLALAAPALSLVAVLIRPTIAPLAFVLGVAWARETRGLRAWAVAAVLAAAAATPFAIWNVAHLGSPFPLGQWHGNARLAAHVFQPQLGHIGYALGGLLISPGRGLLWYAPIALVALAGAWRSRDRLERTAALAIVAQVALISLFFKWSGGVAFGTRLLAEATWLAIWLAASRWSGATRAWRRWLVAAAAVTVVVGLAGLCLFRPEQWEGRRQVDIDENAVWDLVDSPLTSLVRDTSAELLLLDALPVAGYRCVGGRVLTHP